jgi:hypothetical protein
MPQHSTAIDYLERARELAEPLDDAPTVTSIYAYLIQTNARRSLAYMFLQQGDWARALELCEECMELIKPTRARSRARTPRRDVAVARQSRGGTRRSHARSRRLGEVRMVERQGLNDGAAT